MHPSQVSILSAPATPLLTLEQAKVQCRVDIADDDVLLAELVSVATAHVEDLTGRTLRSTQFRAHFPGLPQATAPLMLPRSPAVSVEAISYTRADGSTGSMADADRLLVAPDHVGWIVPAPGQSWPTDVQAAHPLAVQIEFTAGHDPAPPAVVHAVKLLVGHLYEHREASTPEALRELPLGLSALITPWRIGVLAS